MRVAKALFDASVAADMAYELLKRAQDDGWTGPGGPSYLSAVLEALKEAGDVEVLRETGYWDKVLKAYPDPEA
jgi:hypothetical protein